MKTLNLRDTHMIHSKPEIKMAWDDFFFSQCPRKFRRTILNVKKDGKSYFDIG